MNGETAGNLRSAQGDSESANTVTDLKDSSLPLKEHRHALNQHNLQRRWNVPLSAGMKLDFAKRPLYAGL